MNPLKPETVEIRIAYVDTASRLCKSLLSGGFPCEERFFSWLIQLSIWLSLLALMGCTIIETEPTPVPTPFERRPTLTRPAAHLVLPSPAPPGTLTAIIAAFQRTRTPTSQPPTTMPQEPIATPTPIGPPVIYVIPEQAEPGALVELRGSGWIPGEKVNIGLGSSIEDFRLTDTIGRVRSNGTFAATVAIPADWPAPKIILVAESSDQLRLASTTLFLSPKVSPPTATPVLPTRTPPLAPTPVWTASPTPVQTTTPTRTPIPTPTTTYLGWRGEYFANPDLLEPPMLIRDDPAIDFDWGLGSPDPHLPPDKFSVRWQRRLDFVPGKYQFTVTVDDGVRIYIDGQLVLNAWRTTATMLYQFEHVFSGPATLVVEYFDAGGNATIRLQWRYLGLYPDWRGAYYDNPDLAGTPVFERNDEDLDFDWGTQSPDPRIPPDNFSIRWERTLFLEKGQYRFHTQADDGVRIWVDDQLIIDEWHLSPGDISYTGDIFLLSDEHLIKVEYFEAGGQAKFYLWWENLDAYPQWRGAYFNNQDLAGRPTLIRNDRSINFNWGRDGPDGLGPDNFSVQWVGRRYFEAGGYQFFAEHDDGVRVWVDGKLVIDEWYETGPVLSRGAIELPTGTFEIKVEYFEAAGEAKIHVWWEKTPFELAGGSGS